MTPFSQDIQYLPFAIGALEQLVGNGMPRFTDPDRALRQLRYVERYAQDLACQSLVIERSYVDRDYMEDHSVFYSKSLYPYPNVCRRVHFFKLGTGEVPGRLRGVLRSGQAGGETAFREQCQRLSEEAYLGFSVLRPLHGCPVGRTVMRCFADVPTNPRDQTRRFFGGARRYTAHLLGVEFTVRGLAFQQQDIGVSACATTAIWSALQKVRDHEDISAATPAQITLLASKHSLPFGRSMPSEGLSIDQMCQAIQAVGIAPSMVRLDARRETRGFLHAALLSGLAPVAVLRHANVSHAVTVVGMKVRHPQHGEEVARETIDLAGDLVAVYIHDDRSGPYLRANLAADDVGRPLLAIPLREGTNPPEVWELSHLLFPVHAKIRLSFAGLRQIALQVVQAIHQFRGGVLDKLARGVVTNPKVAFRTWIERGFSRPPQLA